MNLPPYCVQGLSKLDYQLQCSPKKKSYEGCWLWLIMKKEIDQSASVDLMKLLISILLILDYSTLAAVKACVSCY